ncbi:hypothetical protein QZH41_018281 [Actinostola sp. cb2023]|nr:hypothetical protein QZH41_018281 [Actinostola sp. cb2023]
MGSNFDSYNPPKPSTSVMSWTVNKKSTEAIQWMIITVSDDLCDGKKNESFVSVYPCGVEAQKLMNS